MCQPRRLAGIITRELAVRVQQLHGSERLQGNWLLTKPQRHADASEVGGLENRLRLADARAATLRGEGMSRPITETGLLPRPVEKMLRVGEESGTLDQQLDAAADYCESERDYKLKRLTTLFEPAVIVFMGLIVGFVAIALISAMYGIYDQVQIK